uniref:Replication helicase subunit n=1 Tax=Nemalion vermiculare TaxID=935621 RepID=UPI00257E279D|nr:Replication helicase subunit [Nemalion vermiculare]WGV34312.1 Replication helicase subunit [Nemalion vermiculare]
MPKKDYQIRYHEQLPPQHNLAEEIIIGGMLINPEITQLVISELSIASFTIETHQLIYRAILEIYLHNRYIDSIVLINTLWELNLLSKVGGINKILNVLKQAQIFISRESKSVNTNAKYYVYLIKDKYIRRLLIQYGNQIIKLAHTPSIGSHNIFLKTNKYLEKIQKTIRQEDETSISSTLTQLLFSLKSEVFLTNNQQLHSGFQELDRVTGGFNNGDLIVVAGRPSMGKTSFSLSVAFNIIQQKHKGICIFSLEMSREQILYKLLAMGSHVPISKLKLGHINQKDWVKIQQSSNLLVNSIVNIDDTANLTVADLIIKTKKFKDEYENVSLVIIDYLQLMQTSNGIISNRSEILSTITRSLKILAKELDIPIIILSQLNRNVENRVSKQPLLSDLRESGCVARTTRIITHYSKEIKLRYLKETWHDQTNKKVYQHYGYKPTITKSNKQYVYCLWKHVYSFVRATHNHKILTSYGWCRVDKFKKTCSLVDYNENIAKKRYVQEISLVLATDTYDVIMPETRLIYTNNDCQIHNSIEQDADLVLMLYREAYYQQNQSISDLTNIIIAKHRNGPTGTIELQFNKYLSAFQNA